MQATRRVCGGQRDRPDGMVLGHQPERRAGPQDLPADELDTLDRVVLPGTCGLQLCLLRRVVGVVVQDDTVGERSLGQRCEVRGTW